MTHPLREKVFGKPDWRKRPFWRWLARFNHAMGRVAVAVLAFATAYHVRSRHRRSVRDLLS